MNRIRKGLLAVTAAAGGAAIVTAMTAAPGAGAATHPHARPQALHAGANIATGTAPTPFQDVNTSAAAGWCNGAGQPCDGSGFGTVDLVPSKFSGGGAGNYAPATASVGGAHMAVNSGTTDVNQGNGCPNPGVPESCTGPYRLFDSGSDSLYKPFTVTHMIYLSPATAGNNTVIDEDTALNDSAGNFGIDNVVEFCSTGGAFTITFAHNSPAGCSGTALTSTAGWVRVVWNFQTVSGLGFLTENVWQSQGGTLTKIATTGPQPIELGSSTSADPVSQLGGPLYFWEPTLNVDGFLPATDLALQSGTHAQGMAP